MAVLLAALAVAVALVRGVGMRTGGWSGPHLLAFAGGTMLCAVGVFLFQRGLRRQARLRAIADLMPYYRNGLHARGGNAGAIRGGSFPANDAWRLDGTEWSDERSEAPLAHAEMRAATRALLVSLEDELRQEVTSRRQRTSHPACRRARLRRAGRAKTERRRRALGRSPRTVS